MQLETVVAMPDKIEPPTHRLAQKAAQGDRQAFAELIREAEPMLYRIAWSMLQNEQDCADAVQDTILSAWRSIGGLRNPAWFRTWLIRILINACKQLLRRRARTGEMPMAELTAPAIHSASACDDALDVRRALATLSDRERVPVMLYYFDDMPIAEIARALSVPEGTVKSRLFAAKKRLKRLLEVDDE